MMNIVTLWAAVLFVGIILRLWVEFSEARQIRLASLLLQENSGSRPDPAKAATILDRTRMILGACKLVRLITLGLVVPTTLLLVMQSWPLIIDKSLPAILRSGFAAFLVTLFLVFVTLLLFFSAAIGNAHRLDTSKAEKAPRWLLDPDIDVPVRVSAPWIAWEKLVRTFEVMLQPLGIARPHAQMVEQDEEVFLSIAGRPAPATNEAPALAAAGDLTEEDMIRAIQRLDVTLVREIMRPINRVVAIRLRDFTPKRLLELARRTGYTRIACYEDRITNLIGYINIYELLDNETLPDDLRPHVTRPLFVPEVARVDQILHEMIHKKQQVAIVFDEFGGTSGFLSRQDILEEIIGDVFDEFERPVRKVVEVRGQYLVDPAIDIDDLNEELGIHLPKQYFDTVAGFVYHRLGRVPRRGDVVEENEWQIRVVGMDKHRIRRLRFIPPNTSGDEQTPTGR